jgi:hypothetical protein
LKQQTFQETLNLINLSSSEFDVFWKLNHSVKAKKMLSDTTARWIVFLPS